MTKSQVVSHLAGKAGIQRKAAAAVLEEVANLAVRETKSSGTFVIPGLGKAVRASRKARLGRNPRTGQPIKIPARAVVKFRLAKAFRDAVAPPRNVGAGGGSFRFAKPSPFLKALARVYSRL